MKCILSILFLIFFSISTIAQDNTTPSSQETIATSNEEPTKSDTAITVEVPTSNPKVEPTPLDEIKIEQEIKKISPQKHEVIRRIALFPIYTDGDYKQAAELSWWKIRETLSDQQRFLVATKRFLEQKEVFQPRKKLSISDAILLSKVLESDCLITGYLSNKTLFLEAYSAEDGQLIWTNSKKIEAAMPVKEQLEPTALKLIQDFIATIPYHGFQIVDALNEKPYTEQGEKIFARIDVGAKSAAKPGEKVQWIRVERTNSNPYFQGGSQISVVAEGEVVSNENQVLTVSVKRSKDLTVLEKKALIYIPEEAKRLTSMYSLKDPKIMGEVPVRAYVTESMVETEERYKESRPLLTALVSIANILLVVLLAF